MKNRLKFRIWTIVIIITCGYFDTNSTVTSHAKESDTVQKAFETIYDFDAQGRLIVVRKPDGTVIKYEYDSDGNVISIRAFDGSNEFVTRFKYDKIGNLIEAGNNYGKTEYFYDPLNQLEKVRYDYPDLEKSIKYEYDPWGRRRHVSIYSDLGAQEYSIKYDYDMLGQLKNVTVNGTNIKYEYDPALHSVKRTLPNDIKSEFKYNGIGKLKELNHFVGDSNIASFKYDYNPAGSINNQVETLDGKTIETKFTYSKPGELSSASSSNKNIFEYNYDETGMLKEIKTPTGLTKFQKNANGLYREIGENKYSYDDLGRVSKIESPSFNKEFKYDSFNRLTEIKTLNETIKYSYSADGHRIGSQVGNKKYQILPDPLAIVDKPLLISSNNFKEISPTRDLSLLNQKNDLRLNLYDPFRNKIASVGINQSMPKFSPSPRIEFEPIRMPDPFEMQRKALSFNSVNRNVWNLIEMGQKLPMPSPQEIASLEQKWISGEYQNDNYYRNLFNTDSPSGSNKHIEYARDTLRTWVPGYSLGEDLFRTGVVGLQKFYGGLIENELNDSEFNDYIDKQIMPKTDLFDLFKSGISLIPGGISKVIDITKNVINIGSKLDFVSNTTAVYLSNNVSDNKMQNNMPGINITPAKPNFFNDHMVEPFTNFIGKGTIWGGANRSGGHFAKNEERDSRNRLPLGDTTIPGINNIDNVYRKHDIQDYVNWHAPEGTVVRVPSPNSTEEFYTSRGPNDKSHNWQLMGDVASNLLPFSSRNINKPQTIKPTSSVDLSIIRQQFSDASNNKIGGQSTSGITQDALNSLGGNFQPKGVKFDKPAEFIGNIGAIKGVSFDSKSKRLTLIGDLNSKLPAMRLDDFAIAIKILYSGDVSGSEYPQFSLEPLDPANPSGKWLEPKFIPDILAGTHMGDVMFKADWILKNYTFGLIADENGKVIGKRSSSVPGYKSYMQLVTENMDAFSGHMTTRFWILPLEMVLERVGDTVIFKKATMQVQSRRMEVAGGTLIDSSSKSDPMAETFSWFFTKNYDLLAKETPILEEVREAAKIVAIVKWLKDQGVGINDYQIDWDKIERQENYMKKIPTLSITEMLSAWGMGSVTLRLVGGVELRPEYKIVPTTPNISLICENFNDVRNNKFGTSVEQFRFQETSYITTVLPITQGGRDFCKTHPAVIHNGLIYAADEKKRVRTVLDAYGNSTTFDYNDKNELSEIRAVSNNWVMKAEVLENERRKITLRSPENDIHTYLLSDKGQLKEVRINGELTVKITETKDDTASKYMIEYYTTVVSPPAIGDLTGSPSKTSKVVCREIITRKGNTGKYTRETMYGNERSVENVNFKYNDKTIEIKGDNFGKITISNLDKNNVVFESASGKILYLYDGNTGLLKKIQLENGDFIEFSPDASTIIRLKKGKQTGEITTGKDIVKIKDLNGRETVYQYANGLLEKIKFPTGISHKYIHDKNGSHLQAVEMPDGSKYIYRWINPPGAGTSRLTVWKEM